MAKIIKAWNDGHRRPRTIDGSALAFRSPFFGDKLRYQGGTKTRSPAAPATENPDALCACLAATLKNPRHFTPCHGSLLAMEIGLPAIRVACPRFDAWLTRLERLAD